MQTLLFIYFIAAFALGAIPFGKLISRLAASTDITRHGSGNIGATNVARTIGIRWGLMTLIMDALKGFLPVFLFPYFFSGFPMGPSLGGFFALLGHQFSPILKFRGGKGVATALGMYLALAPGPCLLAMALFVVIVYFSDIISLGSMICACAIPLFLLAWGKPAGMVFVAIATAFLICVQHRDNISRLVKGQEMKWRGNKDQDNNSKRRSSSSSE